MAKNGHERLTQVLPKYDPSVTQIREVLPKMLAEIAQEMINEQKITGGIVRKTLSRGLVLTLSSETLSLTRKEVKPSSLEERIVLEAFGLKTYDRDIEFIKGYWVVRHALNDLPLVDRAWLAKFNHIRSQKYPSDKVYPKPLTPKVNNFQAEQAELFVVPVTQGSYSYK